MKVFLSWCDSLLDGPLYAFHFFKDKKEYDDSEPDEHENAQQCFSLRIHYREVEYGMQYNSYAQPKGRIHDARASAFIKCKCHHRADGAGREDMEQCRTDKTELARQYRIGKTSALGRSKNKKRVFKRGKTKRDGNHVDDSVNGLVHLLVPEDDDERGAVFQHFFDDDPYEHEVGLAKTLHRESLEGQDQRYYGHACNKRRDDEPLRLGMRAVFPQPKPQPKKRRHETARQRHKHIRRVHRVLLYQTIQDVL